MVKPSDLTRSETANRLLATSIVWMLAAAQSWCDVPSITTSDLSAFSCSPFRKNHSRTADEQSVRMLRAGTASQAFMAMNSCVVSELVIGNAETRVARQLLWKLLFLRLSVSLRTLCLLHAIV